MTAVNRTKTTVGAIINTPVEKVWDIWNNPTDIVKWKIASPDWHCSKAENDLRVGGKLRSRMEAKDGSYGFDFEATYDEVIEHKKITYTMTDGRQCNTTFENLKGKTKVATAFYAKNENPVDCQKADW